MMLITLTMETVNRWFNIILIEYDVRGLRSSGSWGIRRRRRDAFTGGRHAVWLFDPVVEAERFRGLRPAERPTSGVPLVCIDSGLVDAFQRPPRTSVCVHVKPAGARYR